MTRAAGRRPRRDPDPGRVPIDRIMFEFLKRNAAFRRDYAAVLHRTAHASAMADAHVKQGEREEAKRWRREAMGERLKVLRRYGIERLVTGHDSGVLFSRPPYEITAHAVRGRSEPLLAARAGDLRRLDAMLAEPQHVAFVFDLRASIEKQLRAAGRALKERAAAARESGSVRLAKGAQREGKRTDYRAMLWALDAEESGATLREIADELYPGQSKLDTVRKLLKEARRIRDGGYRDLLVLGRRPVRRRGT